MAQPERLNALRAKLRAKAAPVARLLESPDGAEMMRVLEDEFFNGPMLGDTPEKTAFNVGAREVVLYLRLLRDFNKKHTPDPLE